MSETTNGITVSEMEQVMESSQKEPRKRESAPYRHTSYRICKDCGKMYVLSDKDTVFYVKTYDSLPSRCKKCRNKRHKKSESNTENVQVEE